MKTPDQDKAPAWETVQKGTRERFPRVVWEGKRMDEEEIQDTLVVEEVMIVNLPLVPIPFVSFPCYPRLEDLPAKKQLNKPIDYMHKNPTLCIIC